MQSQLINIIGRLLNDTTFTLRCQQQTGIGHTLDQATGASLFSLIMHQLSIEGKIGSLNKSLQHKLIERQSQNILDFIKN